MTKCILIRFGDNDFGTTMLAFADVLTSDRGHRGFAEGFLTKERVASLWNALIPSLYLAVQNRGSYAAGSNIDKYMKIQPGPWPTPASQDRILFDDEAIEYINSNQRGWNGEWIYIGLDGSPSATI